MSTQVSAVTGSADNAKPDIKRRSANFHPSVWGDYFLSSASNFKEKDDKNEHQKLKEQVRMMLQNNLAKPSEKLNLIDSIQRLGVFYHFEMEIDEILSDIEKQAQDYNDNENDLHIPSLMFRLLRQHGYKISCDVFNKFTNAQGKFKECITKDARGMLSLYEAAHVRVHGEDILDEALTFTTTHLESIANHFSSPLAAQISHALKEPIRKSIPRIEARHFFSFYEADVAHNENLLRFSKLDFNQLQILHQKELSGLTKWWNKELEVPKKLTYVRDRIVESYFWVLGVYFEPHYSFVRWIMTKVIALATVLDDTYDAYATVEELELFTDAVERWDTDSIHQLPEYMKLVYKILLDVYDEIEEKLAKQGRSDWIHYGKKTMKQLCQAYFVEAKWFSANYIPTIDEYMRNALISGAYLMVATTSFLSMGDIVTKDALNWVSNNPKMVQAVSVVSRLMDDIVSHKFEQERGHVASGVECYMKQYGVTEQEVYNVFRKQVVDAWKDINAEFIRPTIVPMPLLTRILNLGRVIVVLYTNEDGFTNSEGATKNLITSLLVDPVPI